MDEGFKCSQMTTGRMQQQLTLALDSDRDDFWTYNNVKL